MFPANLCVNHFIMFFTTYKLPKLARTWHGDNYLLLQNLGQKERRNRKAEERRDIKKGTGRRKKEISRECTKFITTQSHSVSHAYL